MKVLKVVLTLLLLISLYDLNAQTPGYPAPGATEWTSGLMKTTTGTVRTLVVFVRYRDDNTSTNNWPLQTYSDPDDPRYEPSEDVLPAWAQTIVDPNIGSIGFHPGNLSDYLSLASGGDRETTPGRLRVIGDVKYVVTSMRSTDYPDTYTYPRENRVINEVLATLDGTSSRICYGTGNVDYTQYDNWTFMSGNQYFSHVYLPATRDNIIDHIFIIFRNNPYSYGGIMHLGEPNYYNNFTVDGKTVTYSSGCRTYNAGDDIHGGLASVAPNMAHEYLHWALGYGGHWDQVYAYNKGNLQQVSLMSSQNAGYISTYERYRFGWLTPTVVTGTGGTYTLGDSHKNNTAIMIPLRYDATHTTWPVEYYWIENYVTTNEYSGANPYIKTQIFGDQLTHGLLVYHIENDDFTTPINTTIDIECADGEWAWKLSAGGSTHTSFPDDYSDDMIAKDYPLFHGGWNERDYINVDRGDGYTAEYLPLVKDNTNTYLWRYSENAWLGQSDDFFKEGYADVFDRFSNPASYFADGTPTNVGFQITSFNSDKSYTLNIQTTSGGVSTLRPAKPEGLSVASANLNGITVNWYSGYANSSDPYTGFKIYRREYIIPARTWSNWTAIATVGKGVTSYMDTKYYKSGTGAYNVYYYVTTINGTSESLPSNTVNVSNVSIRKEVADNTGVKVTSNKLSQNYPNPFNPTTSIYYTVKADSKVTLEVFDILGNRVAELVNEIQPAGEYTASFNGGSLPSGMYIYKLQCGNYTETRKMLLMK